MSTRHFNCQHDQRYCIRLKCNNSGRGYLWWNASDHFHSSYGRIDVRRPFSVHIQTIHWLRTQTVCGRKKISRDHSPSSGQAISIEPRNIQRVFSNGGNFNYLLIKLSEILHQNVTDVIMLTIHSFIAFSRHATFFVRLLKHASFFFFKVTNNYIWQWSIIPFYAKHLN